MTAKTKILLILALGLVVSLVGWFVFGDPAGALVGLWALLPAAQTKLQEKKLEGERTQADQDRTAAQAQREELKKKFTLIDGETAQADEATKAKWDGVTKNGPSDTQEAEFANRFGPKKP